MRAALPPFQSLRKTENKIREFPENLDRFFFFVTCARLLGLKYFTNLRIVH